MNKYFKQNQSIFVWDPQKAETNLKKHKISFETAVTAFEDSKALMYYDTDHSENEDRFHLLGKIHNAVVMLVVFTEDNTIRIISARKATKKEEHKYASQ